jgi:DNA-binding NarL/FixJ family response regulator
MPDLRILIADDHPLVRRGVRELLSSRRGWQVVGEASNGAEAVEKVMELKPDVAVLDFSMPRLDGSQAAALIARKMPETAVVVLTMHDSDRITHQVLRAGVRGLVLKSDADRTLFGAIEAVVEQRTFYTERGSNLVLGGYLTHSTSTRSTVLDSEWRLTQREEEVIKLLAQGVTSKEAAAMLKISVRTVESHRSNMSRKLGFRSTADLVRYAIRKGLIKRS